MGLIIGYALSWIYEAPRLRAFSVAADDAITTEQEDELTVTLEGASFVFDGKTVKVTVRAENTGSVPGKKAVMIYASAPQGKLSKPSRVLAGFAKTGLIPAGESEEVEITAPVRAVSSYDDDGRTGLGTGFILDAGHYSFYLGGDVTTTVEAG